MRRLLSWLGLAPRRHPTVAASGIILSEVVPNAERLVRIELQTDAHTYQLDVLDEQGSAQVRRIQ